MGIRTTLAAGFTGLGHFLAPTQAYEKTGPRAGPADGDPVLREVMRDGMLLPHYRTFSGLVNTFSRVYAARWDECLRTFPADSQLMRNDCYLMALFDERTVPLTRWKWQVDDEEDEAGASKKDAKREAVRAGLEAVIRRTWRLHHLREYMREAVWFGRYGAQVLWGGADVGGQPRQVIQRHQPVHGDKIQTSFDGYDLVAVNSLALDRDFGGEIVYSDRTPLLRLRNPEWRQRFIIQRWRMRDGDYFDPYSAGQIGGIGLRHYVYWAWWLRDKMLTWAVDFLEKVGALGLMLFYYEEGNDGSYKAAVQAAKDASTQNALAVPIPKGRDPKTAGVQVIPANTTGAQFLKEFIGDYFESHIERMVVGQTLSAGTEGGGLGGTGVAGLHRDTKFQLLASDAECFDCGYTEDLVQPALQLNWPGSPYRFRWKHVLPDADAEGKLAAGKVFFDMGGELAEEEVREVVGFKKPNPGEKTLSMSAQRKEEASLAAAGQPGADGDGGEDPDQLEAIANKMEAGGELLPEEEAMIAPYHRLRRYLSYSVADWEPPSGERRNWRRKTAGGEYEYSPAKPEERTKKADDPSPNGSAKGQESQAAELDPKDRERVAAAVDRIKAVKEERAGESNGKPAASGADSSNASKSAEANGESRPDAVEGATGSRVANEKWRSYFGDAKPTEMFGAPDGSKASIHYEDGELRVEIQHPKIEKLKRTILKDGKGKTYIRNDEFFVKEAHRGEGLGTEVFAKQVAALRAAGVSHIETKAAGPEDDANGYYTWARLGYDAEIDDLKREQRTLIREEFPDAESVLDIMATAEGREWWKNNGAGFSAEFSLKEGSRSLKVLAAYQGQLARGGAKKSN